MKKCGVRTRVIAKVLPDLWLLTGQKALSSYDGKPPAFLSPTSIIISFRESVLILANNYTQSLSNEYTEDESEDNRYPVLPVSHHASKVRRS